MSRLFGLLSTRPVALSPVLRMGRSVVPASERPVAYGVSIIEGSQALLRHRPKPLGGPIDLPAELEGIESRAMIAHVNCGGQTPVTQDVSPFRFGPWTWAQNGDLPGDERMLERFRDQLPDALRHNVRGHTDTEVFFHLFLARLEDTGISPKQWRVDPDAVGRVLSQTVRQWRHAMLESDLDDVIDVTCFLNNGQTFYALVLGAPVAAVPLRIDGTAPSVVPISDGVPMEPPEGWFLSTRLVPEAIRLQDDAITCIHHDLRWSVHEV